MKGKKRKNALLSLEKIIFDFVLHFIPLRSNVLMQFVSFLDFKHVTDTLQFR